jgi:hypothetical protein
LQMFDHWIHLQSSSSSSEREGETSVGLSNESLLGSLCLPTIPLYRFLLWWMHVYRLIRKNHGLR